MEVGVYFKWDVRTNRIWWWAEWGNKKKEIKGEASLRPGLKR